MKMNKVVAVLFLFFTVPCYSQVKFEQNPFEKAEPFQYQALRSEFWQKTEKFSAEKQYEELIEFISEENIKTLKPNEKAEVYLAIAEVAVKTDHPYLAFILCHEITKIFPLSNQAIRSYFLIEEIL